VHRKVPAWFGGGLRGKGPALAGGHLAAQPIQWKAAWCLHAAGDPAAEDWVAVKTLAVLAGDSSRATAEITAEADAAGLAGTARPGQPPGRRW
jgi:hypothetical protein